jgi:lipopolysaccharide transport system ATP-binding protein
MMPAVRVEHLRKEYDIAAVAARRQRTDSLREALTASVVNGARRLMGGWSGPPKTERIAAVDDVSFVAQPGEVVGIVGRNGAGKSTLLKILSRITPPTSGFAEVHGRLGSLLEVGTGFHPDLTGRDNVFLNGALLGMKRTEILRKFDEIVDFAEVGRFIDTPVKRYSSGMYVRLAFAVAAHLDLEILVVDEVLAVGDAEFQKKCLGKMQNVVRTGRTVLFVSHNMAAVKSLCDRALLLERGRIVADGPVDSVVNHYLDLAARPSSGAGIPADAPRSGTGEARFRFVEILTMDGRPVAELFFAQRFRVRATIEVLRPVTRAVAGVVVNALDGTEIACAFSTDRGEPAYTLTPGWHILEVELEAKLLQRTYTLTLTMNRTDGYDIDWVRECVSFGVMNVAEQGADAYPWGVLHGFVRADSVWRAPLPTSAPPDAVRDTEYAGAAVRPSEH